MSNSSLISSADGNNGISSMKHGRYRLYVWVITASTVLILALLAWPFTVEQFSSTSSIRMKVDLSAIEQSSGNEIIANSIAANTTDERLLHLIDEVRATHTITSQLLHEANTSKLRDAIRVATRTGRSTNCIDIKLVLFGDGTRDEIAFINRLSNAVATELTSGPSKKLNDRLVRDWLQQFSAKLEEQNDFLFQASGLLNEQLVIATEQRNQLFQMIPDMAFTEPPSQPDEITSISLQHKMAQVYQAMQAEQSKNRWPADHPQLLSYRQEIDDLKNRLNRFYKNGGTRRVTNQFMNVASTEKHQTSIEQLLSKLQFTELDTSSLILGKMQKQMQENQHSQTQMLISMKEQLSAQGYVSDAIRLERFDLADSSKPLGGTPSFQQLLMIGTVALLLGGVMAWQYKPEMRIRKFQSAEHASSLLGIPTIGVINESDGTAGSHQPRRWFVTGLFRSFEYVLLLLAVVLIIAMLVNSEIFGNVMENPFRAISKIIWMITPR